MPPLIHILEDDHSIREVVMYILEDAGYEVQASGSVEEFKKTLGNIKPALVLVDIRLPDGDGREVCRAIKASDNHKSIPVILMSAHAEAKKAVEETKADDFIPKPFDITEFLHTIEKKIPKHLG